MNVYDMTADSNNRWVWFFTKHKLALPADPQEERAFFDTHPKIAIVRNTETQRRPSEAMLADYSNLNYNVYPVFSQRAKELLGRHLDGLGRWIELDCPEAPYWLFWITNVVDALDEDRSQIRRFSDGDVMRIESFTFKPERVRDQVLFTLPQRPGSQRLVTQSFVELVRQHRLTGFRFHLLWSLDGGPVSPKLKAWERPSITGLEPAESC